MTIFLGYPSQNIINYLEEKQCFWLEAEEDGLTIRLAPQFGSSFPPNIHISISRDDRQTWTTYDGYVIENLNKGDRVYFRAGYPDDVESFENERICGWNEEQGDIEEPITFVFNNKKVGAHGNLNCLLQKYGRKDTLASYCYPSMFQGCKSLTQAPKLPAQTLADYCYAYMFEGCTSLTSAPELPATTLAGNCYYGMFQGCKSLIQAPRLPATTLTSGCYSYMFHSCKKLSGIEVNYTAWSPTNATINWVNGVSSTGTFKCPSSLPQKRGNNNIPTKWTIETK